MKQHQIFQVSGTWSSSKMLEKAQKLINEKSADGWELISVQQGFTVWLTLCMYVTMSKQAGSSF
ncbi:DUF4177 domain-containing protein [Persicitalea sp.]|uniref:DUF4177 domain-containing protein n=1 Tax=Persicitalea sp. TaxID=3100273 RepID=UPI00359304F9